MIINQLTLQCNDIMIIKIGKHICRLFLMFNLIMKIFSDIVNFEMVNYNACYCRKSDSLSKR